MWQRTIFAISVALLWSFALPAGAEAAATATEDVRSGGESCALLDDGAVRCWGGAGAGTLGYGNTEDIGDNEHPSSAGPVDLGSGRTATQIATNSGQTCAVLDNATLRCWGLNDVGQLGYGNTNNIGDDETPASVGPVDVGAGRTVIAVDTGGGNSGGFAADHTCAILDDGSVRCWGNNTYGQLGYGNTTTIGDNETPGSVGTVSLGSGRTATAISTGVAHTCVIRDDGSVLCWGRNQSGQLGYGNTNDIGDDETPDTAGPVDLGSGRTAVAIGAGSASTCALLDNGTVRCWGAGYGGQLGYGNTTAIGDDEAPSAAGPVNLGSGRTATALDVGTSHACALLDDGTVRCWGANGGALGYGNTNNIGDDETPDTAGPVDLGSGRTASTISAGDGSTCATRDNGTALCWGANFSGKLGYPNTGNIGDDETPGSVGPVDILPPFAIGDSATVAEDAGDTAVPVLTNDTDIDGGPKLIESASDPAHGTVSIFSGPGLQGTGLSYRPDADYCNSSAGTQKDTFTYTLNGGSTATATMTVTCVDDAPVASADTATLTEDAPATALGVLDNDTDVDGGPKLIGSTTQPAHGTVTITGGGTALTYRPDKDYCDSGPPETFFSYTLNGGSTATVSVGVTCVDDPPVAVNDFATVSAGSASAPIPVLANDTDVDGGPKSIVSASDPAHGTVTLVSGGLKYQPDSGYCNSNGGSKDTFTYALNGGSTATVAMTVTCPSDTTPPVVTLTKQPKGKIKTTEKKVKVKVAFESEPGATFKCKLDKADYERCTSPWSVKAKSGPGDGKKHKIYVKATDRAGNKGEPAIAKFRVIRKG